MYQIEPDLTKNKLYELCSEEQIFSHYFNHQVQLKTYYLNPLRNDKNPDCVYKISQSGFLYFHDYALGKSYSPIDIVMQIYNISFKEALHKIKNDIGKIEKVAIIPKEYVKEDYLIDLKVKKENWNNKYLKYWNDYYLTENVLNNFKVSPISYYWINNVLIQCQLSYCYYLGYNQNHKYKILNLKNKYKWTTNSLTNLQGYYQLPKTGKLLIITKSLKDVMVLSLFNIFSVAVQAETISLTKEQYLDLSLRFDKIIVFYDNDNAGLLNSNIISKLFNLSQIYIPICERYNNNIKDISDYIKYYGIEKTKNLLKKLLWN
ncbi:MAG: toprim domain-containing protein [Metamycoplasmataceae bacterium]